MKRLVLCLIVLNDLLVGDRILQGLAASAVDGGGAGITECSPTVGDVDASGLVDLTDGITLLKFLFLGDPAQLAPACFAIDPDVENRLTAIETRLDSVEGRVMTTEDSISSLESDTTLSDLACADG